MELRRIEFTAPAQRDLAAIPVVSRIVILRQIDALLSRGTTDVKKIRGFSPPLFRLRAGDYRVLFRAKSDTAFILAVVPRSQLKGALRRLR